MSICPDPGYTEQPYRHDEIGGWVFSPVRTRTKGGMYYQLDDPCMVSFNAKQGVSLFALGGELVIVASLLMFALLTRLRAKHAARTFWKCAARVSMWILAFYIVAIPVVTVWRTLRGL